jgi:hypothetical protein
MGHLVILVAFLWVACPRFAEPATVIAALWLISLA